ncbi:MAG TPA: HTTM domain-containing protein [Kofleriaceae bacterium]|nr:HTTM domain-containing protein [Kofleriaceae bacterium]
MSAAAGVLKAPARLWRSWVELWDQREPPTALAVVRILVGACVLGDLLQVRLLGLAGTLWTPPPDGMGYGFLSHPWSVRWFGAADAGVVMWWMTTIAAAAFMLGFATRAAGVLMALGSNQLATLLPDGDRGIDAALRAFTVVLVLSQCHARWSIDAAIRRRLGRPFPALVPAWPRLLLFAQLVWIYFSGGHNKGSPEWWPQGGFSALANALSDPHFARFSSGWVPHVFPLPQAAAATTMLFELGSPLLLLVVWFEVTADRPGRLRRWSNRLHLRHVWIATGVVFHLGIAIFLRLGVFPWGMLALYPVLLRAGEVEAIEAAITARLRNSRTGAPPAPPPAAPPSPADPDSPAAA